MYNFNLFNYHFERLLCWQVALYTSKTGGHAVQRTAYKCNSYDGRCVILGAIIFIAYKILFIFLSHIWRTLYIEWVICAERMPNTEWKAAHKLNIVRGLDAVHRASNMCRENVKHKVKSHTQVEYRTRVGRYVWCECCIEMDMSFARYAKRKHFVE